MPDELELVMDIETLEIFEVKYHSQDSNSTKVKKGISYEQMEITYRFLLLCCRRLLQKRPFLS